MSLPDARRADFYDLPSSLGVNTSLLLQSPLKVNMSLPDARRADFYDLPSFIVTDADN